MIRFPSSLAFSALLVVGFAEAFPGRLGPPDLDGSNGVAIVNDLSQVVSTLFFPANTLGDINNDGLVDFAQLAFGATGLEIAVVFGRSGGIDPDFSLADIDGSNGFRVTDTTGSLDSVFQSLAGLGDINGDGIDDFGAMAPDNPSGNKGLVVYGRPGSFPVTLDYADISSDTGFLINDATGPNSGNTSQMHIGAAGDINCDGLADFAIGAPEAQPVATKGTTTPGAAFVIFGRNSDFPDVFDLDSLDGSNGQLLTPLADAVDFGNAVQALGDFNNDGCDDLAVADLNAPAPGQFGSGAVVIFYGSASQSATLAASSLDGSNGFVIRTDSEPDQLGGLGTTLAAGDINGDGIPDLVAAAPGGTGGTQTEEGGVLIYYGGAGNPALVRVNSNGGAGFTHTRGFAGAGSNPGIIGVEVAAGDVTGDGIGDVIFGSPGERPDDQRFGAGLVYALFGRSGGLGANISVSALDGRNGFVFEGEAAGDGLGGPFSLGVGDVTGDGIADILVGGTGTSDRPDGSGDNALFVIYGENTDRILRSGFEAGEVPPTRQ